MRNLSRSAPLTGGGTVSGDLTITGDLTVQGSATNTYDEQVQGRFDVLIDAADGGTTPFIKIIDADDDTTANTISQILWGKYHSGTSVGDAASIDVGISEWGNSSGNRHTYMTFNTVADGNIGERVRITDVGNVNIGSAASAIQATGLHVAAGAPGVVGNITIESSSNATSPPTLHFAKARGSVGSRSAINTAGGDVLGSLYFTGFDGSNDRAGAEIQALSVATSSTGTDMPADLVFLTSADGTSSPTERMRIKATGNVIIKSDGTAEHSGDVRSVLHVHKADGTKGGMIGYDNGEVMLSIASNNGSSGINFITHNGSAWGERLRIHTDGNVGIGTDSPNELLTLKSSVAGSDDIFLIKADDDGNLFRVGKQGDDDAYLEMFDGSGNKDVQITTDGDSYFNGGNVGIGTSSPGTMLHLKSSTSNVPVIKIENNNDDIHPPRIQFVKDVGANAEADGDFLGHIQFKGQDTGDALHTYASIFGVAADVNAGTEDGVLRFAVTRAGTDDTVTMALDAFSRISLSNNDAGTDNTVFGFMAGAALESDAVENTLMGDYAGTAVTTGDYNTAFGKNALMSETVGRDATAFGYAALANQASGSTVSSNNVGVGINTGSYNETGTKNTYVGANAGRGANGNSNSNNVAVGETALLSITTGTRNTSIGRGSGDGLTTANRTVIIGDSAGSGVMTTNASASIPSYADGTVAVGYSALYALTTGAGNTAIGYNALALEDTGDRNTAVGYSSLSSVNGADNNSNTAIGYNSGDVITTGTNNTCLGANTDPSANSGANQTVVGSGATGVADNSVTLGNSAVTAVYMGDDSGAHVYCSSLSVGTTSSHYPSSASEFFTATAENYVANFRHNGAATTSWGINIICGTDDNSGTNIALQIQDGDGSAQGQVTFTGGTVTYGAFTANHDVELPSDDNDNGYPHGTLVEHTEIFYKQKDGADTERGILYKVQKSSSAYAKNVLGAYSGKYDQHDNLHQVYVLGDGHILCNGEKGNIAVGDGICTSSTDGQGMKADKMAMCIGIAQEAVTFSGSESKLVAVQYGLQQFTPWE